MKGKDAVRQYIAEVYTEPPTFSVENLVVEGNFVIATDRINLKNKEVVPVDYSYCDV
ncbi:nuclear transport factor 2 family protein [Pedobacter sp. GR22-6]|uniref:nuclear transport factor 2 family protein n=1 Tax=Pedobacter sp. GR22-6 TaxID=3127957 RepID=UPI00307D6C05